MNFVLERLEQPTIEPVSLAEMKTHLREFASISADKEAQINGLIAAARQWVEEFTGRALIDQQWRLTVGDFEPPDRSAGVITGSIPLPQEGILLQRSPVIAITRVATVDADGTETEVDEADYQLRDALSKWPRVIGLTAATTMRIEYRAGFANTTDSPVQDASVVQEIYKQAMKLWAEAMYDRDEKMMPLLLKGAADIIRPESCNLQMA